MGVDWGFQGPSLTPNVAVYLNSIMIKPTDKIPISCTFNKSQCWCNVV